jgi:hypothetical protein
VAPEGAAICDNCDEILDPSFLDGSHDAPVEGERTDVGPAPTAKNPNRSLRPARLNPRGGWNPRAGATEPAPEARRPYLAPAPTAPPPSPLEEAQRTASDLSSFFRSLSSADRLAAGGAAALLLVLGLPWRWTRHDDDIIGLVAAWPLGLLAVGILVAVYLRARRADAALSQRLRLAQAAGALACAALAGLFLPYATDNRAVRAAGLVVTTAWSRPQLGAYLGVVCGVAVLLGSLTGAIAERR